MKAVHFLIHRIPAVLYGAPVGRALSVSPRPDGLQGGGGVVRRDCLPKRFPGALHRPAGHGARQELGEELVPWTAVPDIQAAAGWASGRWDSLSLRATSIGAYFAMLAVDAPDRALLVSPILIWRA